MKSEETGEVKSAIAPPPESDVGIDLLKMILTGIDAVATLNNITGVSSALSSYQAFLSLANRQSRQITGVLV